MRSILTGITFLLILTPTLSFAQPQTLRAGTYKRYHHNRHFRLSPPKAFDDFIPQPNGVKLINSKDNVIVVIEAFKIENPKELDDNQLLERFRSIDFRNKYFKSINDLSNRKVSNFKFAVMNRKDVIEFIVKDATEQLKPLKSIVFYEYGKEFRLTLKADNYSDLVKHTQLIKETFGRIGIIK